jgi:hypothetical protein
LLICQAVAAAIADKKSDPLVKGFEQEDEDRRRQQRVNESSRASVWGTGQDKRFKFATVRAVVSALFPFPLLSILSFHNTAA